MVLSVVDGVRSRDEGGADVRVGVGAGLEKAPRGARSGEWDGGVPGTRDRPCERSSWSGDTMQWRTGLGMWQERPAGGALKVAVKLMPYDRRPTEQRYLQWKLQGLCEYVVGKCFRLCWGW